MASTGSRSSTPTTLAKLSCLIVFRFFLDLNEADVCSTKDAAIRGQGVTTADVPLLLVGDGRRNEVFAISQGDSWTLML